MPLIVIKMDLFNGAFVWHLMQAIVMGLLLVALLVAMLKAAKD